MSNFALITRIRLPLVSSKNKYVTSGTRWYSKNEDESPEAKPTEKKEPESTGKAKTRLNSLLKEMIADSSKIPASQTVELAKPTKWAKLQRMLGDKPEPVKPKPKEQDIVAAAIEVAESLGGDTKQTESELMKKFLGSKEEDSSDTITSLSDIFKGMKIDRRKPQVEQRSRSEEVRHLMKQNNQQQFGQRQSRPIELGKKRSKPVESFRQITKFDNVNLFGSEPLGIFTSDLKDYEEYVTNTTWEKLMEREMRLVTTHPPRNYFQEMILWTEQGKLWKFPIDNEQGLEEENNVSFVEHIFLDKHLEPWCPQKGPIRHFMELVCVGLSKNPYLTANAKKEHIEWYRNYFEDKRALLKDVGIALNHQIEAK